MKRLSKLLKDYINIPPQYDCDVCAISQDSRTVTVGSLFIARSGNQYDGKQYIKAAIEQGAVAVIQQGDSVAIDKFCNIVLITLPNIEKNIAKIAARFYDHPSKCLTIIGVTGTNGKTSCCYYLAQLLSRAGYPCAYLGTLGAGFPDNIKSGQFTTPEPIQLQQQLADFVNQGATFVALEVSSHSLAQDRIAEIDITIAAFTNLSHDHLDYHHTMDNYARAKYKLFENTTLKTMVINCDDSYGILWAKKLVSTNKLVTYSQKNIKIADSLFVWADHIIADNRGTEFTLHSSWGTTHISSSLIGTFNVSNLLLVIAVCGVLNIELKELARYIKGISAAPGRMQKIAWEGYPTVIIDYAHTPDALKQTLLNLRNYCDYTLWCVFGCGGNRDKDKRPIMGHIAEQYADRVIVTNDNPRNEDPEIIIDHIRQGFDHPEQVLYELDREEAVKYAMNQANSNDCILIAGKGHEDYQLLADQKIYFSDIALVEEIMRSKLHV